MPGPSGYITAHTRGDAPDPMAKARSRTQSRADQFPYDMDTGYGKPTSMGMDGATYQKPAGGHPPVTGDAWEELAEALGLYEPGPHAPDSQKLGYGSHGLMGSGFDPLDLDMDALRQDFRTAFVDSLPKVKVMPSRDLFSLLSQLDPDFSAELFAPEDDEEMFDIYTGWGQRVYAPGAEDDLDDEDFTE